MSDETPDELPLAGVTVVAIEHAVAGPMASRQLADLGARVIKIERIDGGDFGRHYDDIVRGMSTYLTWNGRGKESLALDLKAPEGADILGELLGRADVLVHNLAPGALDRLGFGTDAVRERFPRLIVASISGYGEPGPYAGKRAYDALVQCEAGFVAATGEDETMVKPGLSIVDIATGMYTFSGILAALYRRERTGRGGSVEVTMLEAAADWVAPQIYYAKYSGREPRRMSLGHPSLCPYGSFPTADGTSVALGVQNDREWVRLAEVVLGRPELGSDPEFARNMDRVRNRDRTEALVTAVTATMTEAELLASLDRAQIAYGRINSLAAAGEHPQLAARDRWVSVDSPVGPVDVLRGVLDIDGPPPAARAVPGLGEHTDALLAELGHTPPEINELRTSGIIG